MEPMSSRNVDVCIVGAGVAGLALALALCRLGMTTVVIEAERHPRPKVGESVGPEIRRELQTLGTWKAFVSEEHRPCPARRSAWAGDQLEFDDLITNPYGQGWHLDRNAFDRMLLVEAQDRGTRVWRGTRAQRFTRQGAGWQLALGGAHSGTLRARFLVDATGRNASVARRLGLEPRVIDRLVGLVAFVDLECSKRSQLMLVEAAHHGWWYSARLDARRVVSAYMTDVDLIANDNTRDHWRRMLAQTSHTRAMLGAAVPQEFQVRSAHSAHLVGPFPSGFVAVGDALAAYDPLSSQGIQKALASGIDAAEAIARENAGQRVAIAEFVANSRRRFLEYLSLRRFFYRKQPRWPGSAFWCRRWGLDVHTMPITLDPKALLYLRPDDFDSAASTVAKQLGLTGLGSVRGRLRTPIVAHELATYLLAQNITQDNWTAIAAVQLFSMQQARKVRAL